MDYTILLRSLQRRPASHFVTLVFPWWYTGHDATKRLNKFFKLLGKALRAKFLFHWRYDGTARGNWPHVHVLVISERGIPQEDVSRCWREVWPGEADDLDDDAAHVRECDGDTSAQAQYVTKHGRNARQVKRQEWQGRLSGGSRKFFVAPRRQLFTDPVYREERETLEYWQLLCEWEGLYAKPDDASVTEEKDYGKDVSQGDSQEESSLYVSLLTVPFTVPLPANFRSIAQPNRTRQLPCKLWPIPPPNVVTLTGGRSDSLPRKSLYGSLCPT